jgi:hypothetical protein
MVSEEDGSISDESVLYQGTWLAFDTANKQNLTTQIEEQRFEYSVELTRLKDTNEALRAENSALIVSAGKDSLTIQALQSSNDEMVNEISELATTAKAETIAAINRRAKEAAALARYSLKERQQSISLNSGIVNYSSAAKNLQKFSL